MDLGLARYGKGVRISDKASIYGATRVSIGDYTRIDDFCIISAGSEGILIGANVHIAAFSSLIGHEKISIDDFSNISSRVSIYSSNDDYSGETMTNPTIPDTFKDVSHKRVSIGQHVIIGSGSVVLPGSTIPDGVAIGSLSLIKDHLRPWTVYGGIPVKAIRPRKKGLLKLCEQFTSSRD